MKFDAIQLHSVPEALVQQIVTQIENGDLKRGTCLPSQRELAKMFNVGLGTVREAVKILHVMGYVDVIRGKGTFVSENAGMAQKQHSQINKALEAVSLADLMKARQLVECEVAFLAATDADAENVQHLKRITDAMEASFKDTQAFYDLDFEFHLAVAEAANNIALLEIVKLLVDRAHNHIGFMDNALSMSMPFNVETAVATARNVVRHIENGDGDRARQEMARHLNIVNYELKKEFLGDAL
jgi:GntR family transcriptional regulator, transcriptional repressor for pyruvate dehydrogenase complex